MTTVNLMTPATKKDPLGRGRPIDPDVQERKLTSEVTYIRKLQDLNAAQDLRSEAGLLAFLKRTERMRNHTIAALRARTLLTANS